MQIRRGREKKREAVETQRQNYRGRGKTDERKTLRTKLQRKRERRKNGRDAEEVKSIKEWKQRQ